MGKNHRGRLEKTGDRCKAASARRLLRARPVCHPVCSICSSVQASDVRNPLRLLSRVTEPCAPTAYTAPVFPTVSKRFGEAFNALHLILKNVTLTSPQTQ